MHEQQITNDQLIERMNDSNTVIVDVRETEEYAMGHVPSSVLIPLGQLEERCNELDKADEIFIICQTGGRSNVACHILSNNGFTKVYNVLPGMIFWTGEVDSDL